MELTLMSNLEYELRLPCLKLYQYLFMRIFVSFIAFNCGF